MTIFSMRLYLLGSSPRTTRMPSLFIEALAKALSLAPRFGSIKVAGLIFSSTFALSIPAFETG